MFVSPLVAAAVTVTVVVPDLSGSAGMLHLSVPWATPLSPRSVLHFTITMPLACDAVPTSASDEVFAEYCGAVVGEVMRTTGSALDSSCVPFFEAAGLSIDFGAGAGGTVVGTGGIDSACGIETGIAGDE